MIPLKDDTPRKTFPFVTITILAVNIAIFVYEMMLGPRGTELFIYKTAAIPYEIVRGVDMHPASVVPPPFTILTAMFVHGGLFHVAGNMLFLWIFGDNIEDAFGHVRFFIFYLAAGIVASLVHVAADAGSTVPMVGASGAVAGVLGAYFMLYPRANVLTLVFLIFFVTVVRIPAIVFLGIWFVFQVLSSGAGTGPGGGVAWFAHIGGFMAGAAAVALFRPKVWRERGKRMPDGR